MLKPSARQKRLAKYLVEALLNGGTAKEAMRKAGYSEWSVHQFSIIMQSPTLQLAMEPVLNKIRTTRDKALDRMDALIDDANIENATKAVAALTKAEAIMSSDGKAGGKGSGVTVLIQNFGEKKEIPERVTVDAEVVFDDSKAKIAEEAKI